MGVRGADGPDATGEEQAEGGACSEEELWGLGGGLWKRRRCSEKARSCETAAGLEEVGLGAQRPGGGLRWTPEKEPEGGGS